MLLAFYIGNTVRTILSLHQCLNKPMNKSGVLAICRLIELLKCIQYTFHRRALVVAEYLVLIVNHYELGLLNQLNYTGEKIQENQQKGFSERALVCPYYSFLVHTVIIMSYNRYVGLFERLM